MNKFVLSVSVLLQTTYVPYHPYETAFFIGAAINNFIKKTFGSGSKILSESDGGTGGILFQSKLAGHKGIYIMQVNYPASFGALGHATLFNGNDCIGGHNYFNAPGGVYKITVWDLN